jgi:uncharacterized protein (DUF2384 family)
MRRRDKAGGKAIKTQRLKKLKRLKASKIARRRKSIATGMETNVERLTRELAGAVTEQEQLTQEYCAARRTWRRRRDSARQAVGHGVQTKVRRTGRRNATVF